MIGETISHYRIIEKLGEGGMGVVYMAEDTTLKRAVALKFLPPEMMREPAARARFLHEAQAAAAMNHPNICTIYEVGEAGGQAFIAMALIEGESLRDRIGTGPLRLGRAIDLSIQIAEGLATAHGRGIIHRDMKPENVMVTTDGRVKILDFGLAISPGQTRLTAVGMTTGTAAYMSPEQCRGSGVDHRTDIWSFGVMLYEMVTGQLPFKGDRGQALIYSIANEEPEPLTALRTGVPLRLEHIVEKAMAKDPERRYQHVDDLLVDLKAVRQELEAQTTVRTAGSPRRIGAYSRAGARRRWLAVCAVAVAVLAGALWVTSRRSSPGAGPTPAATDTRSESPSIAVLPFLDMSPERDQEYFCDGMSEELINALTHVGGLRVSSRTSSFQYKGQGHDIRQIGDDLGVETVLEGSVRKSGSRLRITAQLIDVADGSHLWSESYDRDMEDVFAIQDEISRAVVEELRPALLGEEKIRLAERATANPEAYNLYLRGRWFWNKRTPEDLMQGIEYFKRAIEIAPDYALAYAGMADCYTALAEYSISPPEGVAVAARSAALRALEIDDELPEAHAALGYIKIVYDWDWEGAEEDFRRAIEFDPRYAPAHHRYAVLLSITGRYEEGLTQIRRAQALEPHSVSISTAMGLLLCNVGEPDAAIDELQRAMEMDPGSFMTDFTLGVAYMYAARYDEALAAFKEQNRLLGGRSPHATAMIGMAQAMSGDVDGAEHALAELRETSKHQPVSPALVSLLCFTLGRKDEGFEWLDEAYDRRDLLLRLVLPVLQRPDVAGGDPRLAGLQERMGLAS